MELSSAPGESHYLNITVQEPYGTDHSLRVAGSTLISDIITLVFSARESVRSELESSIYRLVYAGRVLASDRSLDAQGIPNSAVLLLIRQSREQQDASDSDATTANTQHESSPSEQSSGENVNRAHRHTVHISQTHLHHLHMPEQGPAGEQTQHFVYHAPSVPSNQGDQSQNREAQDYNADGDGDLPRDSSSTNESRPHHHHHQARILVSQVTLDSAGSSRVPSYNDTRNILRTTLLSLGFSSVSAGDAGDIAAAIARSSHFAERSANLTIASTNEPSLSTSAAGEESAASGLGNNILDREPVESETATQSVRASECQGTELYGDSRSVENGGSSDAVGYSSGGLARVNSSSHDGQDLDQARHGHLDDFEHNAAGQTERQEAYSGRQPRERDVQSGLQGSQEPSVLERAPLQVDGHGHDAAGDDAGERDRQRPGTDSAEPSDQSGRNQFEGHSVEQGRNTWLLHLTHAAWRDLIRAQRIVGNGSVPGDSLAPETGELFSSTFSSLPVVFPIIVSLISDFSNRISEDIYPSLFREELSPEENTALRNLAHNFGSVAAALTTFTALLTTHIERANDSLALGAEETPNVDFSDLLRIIPAFRSHVEDLDANQNTEENNRHHVANETRDSEASMVDQTNVIPSASHERHVATGASAQSDPGSRQEERRTPMIMNPMQLQSFVDNFIRAFQTNVRPVDGPSWRPDVTAGQPSIRNMVTPLFEPNESDDGFVHLLYVVLEHLQPSDLSRMVNGDFSMLRRVRAPLLQFALANRYISGTSTEDVEHALLTGMSSMPETEMRFLQNLQETRSRYNSSFGNNAVESRVSPIIRCFVLSLGRIVADENVRDEDFPSQFVAVTDRAVGEITYELSCLLRNGWEDVDIVIRAYIVHRAATILGDFARFALPPYLSSLLQLLHHSFARYSSRNTGSQTGSSIVDQGLVAHNEATNGRLDSASSCSDRIDDGCDIPDGMDSSHHSPGRSVERNCLGTGDDSHVSAREYFDDAVTKHKYREDAIGSHLQQGANESRNDATPLCLSDGEEQLLVQDLVNDLAEPNGEQKIDNCTELTDEDFDSLISEISKEIVSPQPSQPIMQLSGTNAESTRRRAGGAYAFTDGVAGGSRSASGSCVPRQHRAGFSNDVLRPSPNGDGLDGLLGMREAARVRAVLQRDSSRLSTRNTFAIRSRNNGESVGSIRVLDLDYATSLSSSEVRTCASQVGVPEEEVESLSRQAGSPRMGQLLLPELERLLRHRLRSMAELDLGFFPNAARRFHDA